MIEQREKDQKHDTDGDLKKYGEGPRWDAIVAVTRGRPNTLADKPRRQRQDNK
jgi:hypothetical protein